jgi:hypothetical protein
MAIYRELTRRCQSQHICEPLEKSYHVTNWSSAWRGLDFTPALEVSATKERQGKVPSVLVLGESMESSNPCRCEFPAFYRPPPPDLNEYFLTYTQSAPW